MFSPDTSHFADDSAHLTFVDGRNLAIAGPDRVMPAAPPTRLGNVLVPDNAAGLRVATVRECDLGSEFKSFAHVRIVLNSQVENAKSVKCGPVHRQFLPARIIPSQLRFSSAALAVFLTFQSLAS